MNTVFSVGLGVVTLVAVAWLLRLWGAKHWRRFATDLRRKLEAGGGDLPASPQRGHRYQCSELKGLPAPVQRYFNTVLKEGQPMVKAVELQMLGHMNLSTTAERWRPFSSTQRVTTQPPGFVWDANVAMLPGVGVHVADSYIVGVGALRAAALGLFTVADSQGGSDVARGELMRYFAEAAWYPTALLPSQGVLWEAVDDTSANATLIDGALRLTLLFHFNRAGLIDSFRAAARGAMVDGKTVNLPWEGRWSNYQTLDSMLVPLTGEVAWVHPQGRRAYFRGTVTSLRYEWLR